MDKKTGRTRYRYVYNVTHKVGGKHIDDHDNMKVNSKYMWHSEKGEEVHVHVKKVNKDGSLVLMYDDGEKAGEEFTMTKKDLAKKLREEHNIEEKFKEKIKKVKHDLAMAKKHGTQKQIRRLEKELASLQREGVKKPVDKKKDLSNTEKDDSNLESTKEQETSNTGKEQAMSFTLRLKGQGKKKDEHSGLYDKVFKILERDSLGFVQTYADEKYIKDGDDMILTISPRPDWHEMEEI